MKKGQKKRGEVSYGSTTGKKRNARRGRRLENRMDVDDERKGWREVRRGERLVKGQTRRGVAD